MCHLRRGSRNITIQCSCMSPDISHERLNTRSARRRDPILSMSFLSKRTLVLGVGSTTSRIISCFLEVVGSSFTYLYFFVSNYTLRTSVF